MREMGWIHITLLILGCLFGIAILKIVFAILGDFAGWSTLNQWLLVATAFVTTSYLFYTAFNIWRRFSRTSIGQHFSDLMTALGSLFEPQSSKGEDVEPAQERIWKVAGSAFPHLCEIGKKLAGVVGIAFTGLLLVGLLGILFPLIYSLPAQLQVLRISEQNILVATQNKLLIESAATEGQVARAASKLAEIKQILLDPNSPIQIQLYALKQIPTAVSMEVKRPIRSAEDGSFTYHLDYPNLLPIRALIADYIRFGRVDTALEKAGIVWDGEGFIPKGAMDQLEQLSDISTETLKLLHQFGPSPKKNTNADSIWGFVPDGKKELPPARLLEPSSDVSLATTYPGQKYQGKFLYLDLSHLPKDFFEYSQLPCAFRRSNMAYGIKLSKNSNFVKCHFEGWAPLVFSAEACAFTDTRLDNGYFIAVEFRDVQFVRSSLNGTNLEWANLNNSSFFMSQIVGTKWKNADLTGSNFSLSSIKRCIFDSCSFDGLTAFNSRFTQSRFTDSTFHLASFTQCGFGASEHSNSSFYGADLTQVEFIGARLTGSLFSGSRLADVCFAGSELDKVSFAGSKISDVTFGGRTVTIQIGKLYSTDFFGRGVFVWFSIDGGEPKNSQINIDHTQWSTEIGLIVTKDDPQFDNAKPVTQVNLPGAIIHGPSFLNLGTTFEFIDETDLALDCLLYEALNSQVIDARFGQLVDVTKLNSPTLLRMPWNSDLIPKSWRYLTWEAERYGWKNSLLDDGVSYAFDVGERENAAWIDSTSKDELNALVEEIASIDPSRGQQLESVVTKVKSFETAGFEERKRWQLESVLEDNSETPVNILSQ